MINYEVHNLFNKMNAKLDKITWTRDLDIQWGTFGPSRNIEKELN